MGNKWLHDLVQPLQQELGDKLTLFPGYATRSRSTGGFDDVRGFVWHHDAWPMGREEAALNYEVLTSPDRPIANFKVNRDGRVIFHTAGASNHAGKGGPLNTSRGVVSLDQGNKYLIGAEFANNGLGEPWPKAQLDSGFILVSTIFKTYGLKPDTDLYGHGPRFGTWVGPSCPGRKVDPSGPTPSHPQLGGVSGNVSWNITELRNIVKWVMGQTSVPTPPEPIPPAVGDTVLLYKVKSGDSYWRICETVYSDGRATQARVEELKAVNGNKALYPDMLINIPGRIS